MNEIKLCVLLGSLAIFLGASDTHDAACASEASRSVNDVPFTVAHALSSI